MLIYIIIVLVIIVIFLDHHVKTQEPFNPTTKYEQKLNDIQVFDHSDANSQPYNRSKSAMNTHMAKGIHPRNFRDFGIIGKIMPDPVVDSCYLDFGCTNYVYDADEKNENVCRRCNTNAINKNYNELDRPLYVMARSAGRPRVPRQVV